MLKYFFLARADDKIFDNSHYQLYIIKKHQGMIIVSDPRHLS